MTTFTHHPRFTGGKPWVFDPAHTYTEREPFSMKPSGFWLSVDHDWGRWCRGEGMDHWLGDPVEFHLDADAVLWLRSVADIDQFSRDHAGNSTKDHVWDIEWAPVIEEYAGIVIAPYQWSRRLEGSASWYYSWDCASACIWDLSALTLADALVGDPR